MKKRKTPEEIKDEGMEAMERLTRELGLETTIAEATASVRAIAGPGISPPPGYIAGHLHSPSPSFDERIEELVRDIVLKVLEDEKVLIEISGRVKKFSKDAISISKSDPKIADISVEKKEEKDSGFMEELSKLR